MKKTQKGNGKGFNVLIKKKKSCPVDRIPEFDPRRKVMIHRVLYFLFNSYKHGSDSKIVSI